jgi:hypothetical protein
MRCSLPVQQVREYQRIYRQKPPGKGPQVQGLRGQEPQEALGRGDGGGQPQPPGAAELQIPQAPLQQLTSARSISAGFGRGAS